MPNPSPARMHDFEVVSNEEIAEGTKRALVVGGGIGVPPVLCLARELVFAGVAVDACVCTASASKLVGAGGYDYVATCGPGVMMSKVAAAAAEAGACSTCTVETTDGMQGACMCGPVFDASKVVVW